MEQPEEQGFEIVAGPRQIGAILFVVIAVIGTCSAIAYVAGKTAAAASRMPKALPPIVAVTPPPPPQIVQVSAPQAASEPEPCEPAKAPKHFPLESPKPGEVYLQVAAVPKGVADVYASGFAARGARAVLAASSSEAIVRVLLGPFQDKQDLSEVKVLLERDGFTPFVREYTAVQNQLAKTR